MFYCFQNVLVEGTLRLEYGKSGIYDNNRLPAKKKKKEKEKEKIPGIGRYPMGPTTIHELSSTRNLVVHHRRKDKSNKLLHFEKLFCT